MSESISLMTARARCLLQTFPSPILAAAARGDLDLLEVVCRELASRGLDRDGEWVGFKEAERIHIGAGTD